MSPSTVFQRNEKKYILTQAQRVALLDRQAEELREDVYGRYAIRNIYFDTPDYLLARRSLEKPYFKEKLRMRSYGAPSEGCGVFLEMKRKCGGTTYKRRECLNQAAYREFLSTGHFSCVGEQIGRELDYFCTLYPLVPRVFLAYEREAYVGTKDGNLRLTFDTNVRARTSRLELDGAPEGAPLMDEDMVLMEVKAPCALPLSFVHAFEELGICGASFSKYGAAYREILREGGEIVCSRVS